MMVSRPPVTGADFKIEGTWADEDSPREHRVRWSRGPDLNRQPPGYEPDELPDCSTPHGRYRGIREGIQVFFAGFFSGIGAYALAALACLHWLARLESQGMKPWQRSSVYGAVAMILLATSGWAQQTFLKSEIRNRLKESTVVITTTNDDDGSIGSGFVFKKDGEEVYIATNQHVIDAQKEGREVDEDRTRLRVVFAGTNPRADSIRAELLAADQEHDLAILRVKKNDAPEPFELFSKQTLEETQPITIFGYPLGDRDITVNNAQVSSFRHDKLGGMRRIKFFGKVDSGNSGGPVVDNEGAVVGVTVEKDRRADDIGYAIPAFELHQMLRGRLGNIKIRQEGGPGTYDVNFAAKVLDPFGKLQSAKLHFGAGEDLTEKLDGAVSENGAKWSLLSSEMKSVPVSLSGGKASVRFQVTGEPDTACYVQLSYEREGEPGGFSQPIKLTLGDPKPILPGRNQRDRDKGEDGKGGRYPLPREVNESILGTRVPINGFHANEWRIDAKSIIPNIAWDEHSMFVYLVSKQGLVRKIDPFRNQIDLEIDLKLSVQWAVLSGEGLVLLTTDDQLWIVDERDLKVRRVIESIPGASHVTSSLESFYAFCVTGNGKTLEVYDLVDGEKTQTYEASDFQLPSGSVHGAPSVERFGMLTMSPGGRFLFCESNKALHRFVVQDDEINYDEASAKLGRSPERIQISEDGLYVSLVDRKGNHKQGGVSIEPFGIYVFKVMDLVKPVVAVDGGQPTPYLVRQDLGRSIYGTIKNSPLVRFDLEGTKVREFPELEGEFASQILLYSKRPGFFLVLTDAKTYVLKLR